MKKWQKKNTLIKLTATPFFFFFFSVTKLCYTSPNSRKFFLLLFLTKHDFYNKSNVFNVISLIKNNIVVKHRFSLRRSVTGLIIIIITIII